jgi:hypothetical protein
MPVFYKGDWAVLSFTVCVVGEKKEYYCLCNETRAERGSNETAFCLRTCLTVINEATNNLVCTDTNSQDRIIIV